MPNLETLIVSLKTSSPVTQSHLAGTRDVDLEISHTIAHTAGTTDVDLVISVTIPHFTGTIDVDVVISVTSSILPELET